MILINAHYSVFIESDIYIYIYIFYIHIFYSTYSNFVICSFYLHEEGSIGIFCFAGMAFF